MQFNCLLSILLAMKPITALKKLVKDKSQRQVAKDLGLTEGHISHILTGKRQPGPKLLKALGIERITGYRRERT